MSNGWTTHATATLEALERVDRRFWTARMRRKVGIRAEAFAALEERWVYPHDVYRAAGDVAEGALRART